MEKFFVEFIGLAPYAQALGLVWPVEYFLVPQENTCRITSDPITCRHEVWVPSGLIGDPEAHLCDLVHELCHASLAERIDPAFATIYFSHRYGNLTRREEKDFAAKYYSLYLAWAHVDVWVDEYRQTLFPELTLADHDGFFQNVISLVNSGQKALAILQAPESLLAIAIHLAEGKRFGLDKQDFSKILNCLGRDNQKTVSQMRQFYEDLPHLNFQKEKDLPALLGSVQKAAKKLNLAINPQVIQEDGRQVWLV